jgi:hypothetical protein
VPPVCQKDFALRDPQLLTGPEHLIVFAIGNVFESVSLQGNELRLAGFEFGVVLPRDRIFFQLFRQFLA